MNHQKQFYKACENGDNIMYLLNSYDIDVHADNEKGFRFACWKGHLNVVQYLLENNFNIDVHADNEYGFKWACYFGHLNVVQYLLRKTKMTNEMLKILSEYKYFDEIKKHTRCVKIYNYKLRLCKILFPLYNTINVENSIYFGII